MAAAGRRSGRRLVIRIAPARAIAGVNIMEPQLGRSGADRPHSAARRFLVSPYLAAIVTMFFWAGTTIIVRYVRGDVPPLGLSFWRNLTAFLVILPFAIRPLITQWEMVRQNWKILALLSLLLWVGGNALLFLSLQYTIAINAAVINSVEPLIITSLAWLLFRDPLGWRQVLGLALSLSGVLILITAGSIDRFLQFEFNKGDLIATGAYVAWGLYAVLLRKVPAGLDHRATMAALLGFGALFMLPIYLVEATFVRPVLPTMTTILTVLTLAVFSAAIAMLLWNYAILRLGAARAGQYLHLIPAFTVVLAVSLLGEALDLYHIAGIVFIAAGLLVAIRK